MLENGIPDNPDDPRPLWEIYDALFPRLEKGGMGPALLSPDAQPLINGMFKSGKKDLGAEWFLKFWEQSSRAQRWICAAICDSITTDEFWSAETMRQVAMREFSDERVLPEVKREVVQRILDQRAKFMERLKQAASE